MFKFERLISRLLVLMVERLRPLAVFAFVLSAMPADEMSSSDEYLVAYSVSRLNFDFSLSIRFRSRLIKILRVVLVTGILGTPNCAKRYWSSTLLNSFKSSMSALRLSVTSDIQQCCYRVCCVSFSSIMK